jgi:predicted transcriptional regulator
MKLNKSRLNKALKIAQETYESNRSDVEERKDRELFFQRFKSEEFSEALFNEGIKKLWAMRIWGNKDYIIQKIITSNGLKKLEKTFDYCAQDRVDIGKAYKELSSIKYMGPSMVSELVCHLHPDRAGIWNSRVRIALRWLEIDGIVDKYDLSSSEYVFLNQQLIKLSEIFSKEMDRHVNLLELDYYLWEIADAFENEVLEEGTSKKITISNKSRHHEIRDKIAGIGSGLGFEVDTEKPIAIGARVDVVWKAKIANLGVITYVFEVQDKGSIDSLIVNLQRAQSNTSVQKLIVVSDKEQLKKIKEEIESMPEILRKDITYWDSENVDKVYENLEQVTNSIAELKLVSEDI